MVEWDRVPDTQVPVQGYILEHAREGSEQFEVVYDGSRRAQITRFLAVDLLTGQRYSFRVRAVNHNEEGPYGSVETFNSCVAPDQIRAPVLVNSDTT